MLHLITTLGTDTLHTAYSPYGLGILALGCALGLWLSYMDGSLSAAWCRIWYRRKYVHIGDNVMVPYGWVRKGPAHKA